jgi:bifunctional non-homologous end joining protein LigD
VETIEGVLQTPDGYWRVEAVRTGRREHWFRVRHANTIVADRAALATVKRILGDAYATLEAVEAEAVDGNGVA